VNVLISSIIMKIKIKL